MYLCFLYLPAVAAGRGDHVWDAEESHRWDFKISFCFRPRLSFSLDTDATGGLAFFPLTSLQLQKLLTAKNLISCTAPNLASHAVVIMTLTHTFRESVTEYSENVKEPLYLTILKKGMIQFLHVWSFWDHTDHRCGVWAVADSLLFHFLTPQPRVFADTTGLEEQEREKRRLVIEKFQKAPFEEIAAHCESKVTRKKTAFKKRDKLYRMLFCSRSLCSCVSSGEHVARPTGSNLRAYNSVSPSPSGWLLPHLRLTN